MGTTTRDIFGRAEAQPATPGSYGDAPSGYRLPDATHLGPVRLQIADLERSLPFYERVLGMRTAERAAGRAAFAPHGDDRVLVELNELGGARPAQRDRLGLYHFAILLPDRASLGRFARHLEALGVRAGAGDHLVSEALYLTDPDGLGIEVYVDRPRSAWRRIGRELMMATDPVDFEDLRRVAGETTWSGMPAGSVMGHVHLRVGDMERAAAYFSDALGFDRITWSYPGALFMSAGGYHHHVGTNTWAGRGATPPREDEARLLEWTLELPDENSLAGAQRSLADAGYTAERTGADVMTQDPWGTRIRLRIPT